MSLQSVRTLEGGKAAIVDRQGAHYLARRPALLPHLSALIVVPDTFRSAWGGRGVKVAAHTLSPFDTTVHLDTDTVVCAEGASVDAEAARYVRDALSPAALTELAGRFDLAATHGTYRPGPDASLVPRPDLNTGVLLLANNSRVDRLVARWTRHFDRASDGGTRRTQDQGKLQRALDDVGDARVWVLPPEYNCRGARHRCGQRLVTFTVPFSLCVVHHWHGLAEDPAAQAWLTDLAQDEGDNCL